MDPDIGDKMYHRWANGRASVCQRARLELNLQEDNDGEKQQSWTKVHTCVDYTEIKR